MHKIMKLIIKINITHIMGRITSASKSRVTYDEQFIFERAKESHFTFNNITLFSET